MATEITAREKAIYESDFAKFDKDQNGSLKDEEATEMAIFQLGSEATDAAVDNLIKEMDKNEDGKIELTEYMNKILGVGYKVVSDDDKPAIGKTTIEFSKDGAFMEKAREIYVNGSIPLMCCTDEDTAQTVGTFLQYASAVKTFMTKPLVGKAMQMGKDMAWKDIKDFAANATQHSVPLVFHMGNGAADLLGYARDGGDAEGTLRALFDPRCKDPEQMPGLELEPPVFVHSEFQVWVFSQFMEEDVLDFFSWGPFPLEACHLLVITKGSD